MDRLWPGASLYEATVRHTRTDPVENSFSYGGYYWLVDIDRLPSPGWPLKALVDFDPSDHGDGHGDDLRGDIDRYLTQHGIGLARGKVTMLTHARVLGHVFNPLTVFWCHLPGGDLECVVVEVHNTYGGRHRYLLHPDHEGAAEATKEFYVSPFNPIEGTYLMVLPEPEEELELSITLDRPDLAPFKATLTGRRLAANPANLVRLALRHPVTPLLGALRIRWQGIKLYLGGLPVVPRTEGAGEDRPESAFSVDRGGR